MTTPRLHIETGPLGDQVERFLGKTAVELGQAGDRAAFNRNRWFSILNDQANLPKFLSSLSLCQLSSNQLLRSWLTARLEDSALDAEAKMAESQVQDEHNNEDKKQSPRYHHYYLAQLFVSEFSYPGEGTPVILFTANLQQARGDAALYASCYRLASRSCFSLAGIPQENSSTFEISGRPPYGASIDPCSWLQRKNRESELPFYLWDVKGKQVKLVKTITANSKESPEYVAISHTWGRWIKEKEPWVSISNIPWKIPQNECFEVAELPELLEKFPCDYVWFDLLTIPQGKCSEELYKIQQAEIARQAMIFRRASSAVAWLNNIHAWSTLPSVIRYLCLSYLKNATTVESNREALSVLLDEHAAAIDASIELLDSQTDERHQTNRRTPNPWFTSLWTLQEVCLRPDMWLCNSKWEFLAISENTPIALNDIVALCLANFGTLKSTGRGSTGVRELQNLIRTTGLEGLLRLSELSIITMGNERHCKKRRAEAIMSAVGAVDWFPGFNDPLKDDLDDEDDERLLLGLYPLAFIKEVREKLGSASFFSSTPLGPQFHYVLYKYCSEKRSKRGKFEDLGSLLPIGPGAHSVAWEVESIRHMVEHPTLKTWTIEPTGRVHIRQAGIVSSSFPSSPRPVVPLRCTIAAPSVTGDENRVKLHHDADLHEWTRLYKPWSANIAVCLSHSSLATRGILLKEMEGGIMLKVGSYWQFEQPGCEMPKTQDVDWSIM